MGNWYQVSTSIHCVDGWVVAAPEHVERLVG